MLLAKEMPTIIIIECCVGMIIMTRRAKKSLRKDGKRSGNKKTHRRLGTPRSMEETPSMNQSRGQRCQ